jgi:hypothetical protein
LPLPGDGDGSQFVTHALTRFADSAGSTLLATLRRVSVDYCSQSSDAPVAAKNGNPAHYRRRANE